MSTTSNSRGDRRWLALALGVALTVIGAARGDGPDAPLPADEPPAADAKKADEAEADAKAKKADEAPKTPPWTREAKLREVKARVFHPEADDEPAAEFVPEADLAAARAPIVIEVQLEESVPRKATTTFPVIVLNGKVLKSTRVIGEDRDRLIAFVPDRAEALDADDPVDVAVHWVGNERASRTKTPLKLANDQVEP